MGVKTGDHRGPSYIYKILVGGAVSGRPNREPTEGLPYNIYIGDDLDR